MLRETLDAGRAHFVPTRKGRSSQVEGTADLIVEILSRSSIHKDTLRHPRLYALAGVPELWIVDCRGDSLRFVIHALRDGFPWRYRLEHRA